MPEIARFYGIVIKMFFKPKEHEPSHIHALYGEYMGEYNIKTMEMIQGDLPGAQGVSQADPRHGVQLRECLQQQEIRKLPPL